MKAAAPRRRESLSALGIEEICVFASSLLSLISPWADSSVARYPRCGAGPGVRPPRPPRTPQVPPPPRRHSIPPARPHASPAAPLHTPPHRRYSDVRNPPVSKLDLRQELLNLNLGTQEFHSWIGDKFDETEEYENVFYDDRFEHDIPLQRSISLDRGIDIFNHLQAIGSDSSGSDGSLWSVDSEGRDSVTDRYRSFEDIPTSPYRARSRRASFGVETFSERDLALAVLSESYKNIGATSGSVSPQIRKLQRCFTFSGTFDSIKDRTSVENLPEASERPKLKLLIPKREDSTSCPVSPEISRLKNFFNKSADDVETKMSDDEDQEFEARKPVYRSISVEFNQGEGSAVRQRRSGLQDIMMRDLRRQVLVKQEFRSSENLRNQSPQLGGPSKNPHKITDQNSNTKSNFLSLPGNTDGYVAVPTIVISDADSHGVAKISDTSNYVGISRNCDCRICTEGEGKYFVRSVLSKLFVKIVSCNVRKLYWDENNNLNENEMYKCIMHVLKLMLGLWLRHLDHNQ